MNEHLCQFDDIPDGESRGFEVTVEDEEIELFVVRKGNSVFGYLNDCPHIGTPLNWQNDAFLTFDKSMIICATHGALFQIDDGHCTAGPCIGAKLTPVEIDCVDGEVILKAIPRQNA